MKRKIIVTFLCLLTFCTLMACGEKEKKQEPTTISSGKSNNETTDATSNKHKVIIEENDILGIVHKSEYNDKAQILIERNFFEDGRVFSIEDYKYDKNDNLIQKTVTYSDESTYNELYVYDSENNLIREEHYGENLSLTSKMEYSYKYVGSNKEVTRIEYDKNGVKKRCNITEYTSEGKMLKATSETYDATSKLKNSMIIKYNADEEITEILRVDSEGKTISRVVSEYNSFGKESKNIIYDESGNVSSESVSEYDSNGNLICIKYDGKINSEYQYDNTNFCVKEIQYSNGKVYKTVEYEKDSNNRVKKEIRKSEDGSVSGWHEYEYDADGDCISEKYYGDNGELSYEIYKKYKTIIVE